MANTVNKGKDYSGSLTQWKAPSSPINTGKKTPVPHVTPDKAAPTKPCKK